MPRFAELRRFLPEMYALMWLYPIGKTWLCVALCGFGGGVKAHDQSFVCVPRQQFLRKGQNGAVEGIRGHKWATQTGLFEFLLPFYYH